MVRYIQEAANRGVGLRGMENINAVYVDAQAEKEKEEKEEPVEEEPVKAEPEEEVTEPVEEIVESEKPIVEEPEEEKEAGIPAIILIPALIISFLIGLRMRRMKKKDADLGLKE